MDSPPGLTFPHAMCDGKSRAVICVEPDSRYINPNRDSPFQIQPLVDNIPMDAEDNTNIGMHLNLDSIPSSKIIVLKNLLQLSKFEIILIDYGR